eukprot:CAMPEP_0174267976 /NCGR_PEP_ID=MMETSP0439-20130205/35697_1 /TAXON_ID=0 /ORGANISM="Stereomyxa ramosa, Strain Chinc5" /LENGTH=501 /DNA_ID=CAMNT_0015355839 /DNA_START=92 /DNA_END=1593 /DNA_ORIENTATION=-
MTCLLALVLLLLSVLPFSSCTDCGVADPNKIDCGYVGITKDQCTAKGCCWVPVESLGLQLSKRDTPWCFYPAGGDQCEFNGTSLGAPFSESEISLMRSYFLANIDIQGKGGVAASPDNDTPGGSYFYHWERDGALTMHALQITSAFSDVKDKLKDYAMWVSRVQALTDTFGFDIRTEPKYNLPDGTLFTGGWCRPQTDGPGLRAITLINFAEALIANNDSSFVSQYLWTNGPFNGGVIKYDLDWVAANWSQDGCDLWEEIHSDDLFWNRFTMKNALFLGANFAKSQGDTTSASRYLSAAQTINATLASHYNGFYIFETDIRTRDGSVMNALNVGYSDDSYFAPTDVEVANTISSYIQLFCQIFPINKLDNSNGVPGMLLGRYDGDTYAGGNPWILTTAALAELFYRGASETVKKGALPTKEALAAWSTIFPSISDNSLTFSDFSKLLSDAGDAVLSRIRYHVAGAKFHLPEQLDKNTGFEASATDLTWSYASVLKAINKRA